MKKIAQKPKMWLSAIWGMALGVMLTGIGMSIFTRQYGWMNMAYPALGLALVCTVILFVRGSIPKGGSPKKLTQEDVEANRLVGIAYQGKGLFDLAFEKFRQCPFDDKMKPLLYDLAGDYEKQEMLDKALEVYRYIQKYDDQYEGIALKISLLEAGLTSQDLQDSSNDYSSDTLILDGKPDMSTLGRYEITEELGMGAMGLVYKGQDPKINRIVAIKTVRLDKDEEDSSDSEEVRQRFYREAEAAGGLSHPNIVTIYDVGEEDDVSYIAMECLEGESLVKYAKKPNLLPLRKIIKYMVMVCNALDYAHKHNVIHRDIKPANIMLLKDDTIKVTDFGIARMTTSSRTQTGVILGTPNYMSPEQVEGKKVDGRSDIFSLGILFYQLLTGELPFKGASIAAIMHNISKTPHVPPRQHKPKLPKACIAIIDKALEKDVGKRYQRAGTFGKHLSMIGRRIDELMTQKRKQGQASNAQAPQASL
ncbi:MAG: serine/threonine-protein kinase [Pseudomonadota bacterium]